MINKYIYILIVFGLLANIGFASAADTGGLGVTILPKISSIPLGNQQTYTIKVVSTENVDDTLRVYITTDGISSSYKADLSWFDWIGNTVNIPAGGTVQLQNKIKIPAGISTGNKAYKVVITSSKGISATDSGLFIITPQPRGGLGVGIYPKISSIPLGSQQSYTIKVVSTENFDDIVSVSLSNDGIPLSNQLDLSLFDWKYKTVTVPAGRTIELQDKLTIPTGISTGERNFKVVAKSSTGISVSDSGTVTINPPTTHIVQSPKTDPSSVLVGEPTSVTITAKINPVPELLPTSVTLQRLDDNNNVIANLGQLYDDKTHGDVLPGDSIFTTQVSFNEPNDGKVKLRISVSYSSPPSPVFSDIFTIDVIKPIDEVTAGAILSIQSESSQQFENLKQIYGEDQARQKTVDWLKGQTNVQDAGISTDSSTIWIQYTSGIEGDIVLNPENTWGSPITQSQSSSIRQISLSSIQTTCSGSSRAIVLAPFDWRHNQPARYIADKLSVNCIGLETGDIITNSDVTLSRLKTLSQYGIIVITTEGWMDDNQPTFASGEEVTISNMKLNYADLKTRRLTTNTINGKIYYGIRPEFISHYGGTYPNSLVYLTACSSFRTAALADAFINKGAGTFFGWSTPVSLPFGDITGERFFDSLIDSHMTTLSAYNSVPHFDPFTAPNSEFRMKGSQNLVIPTGVISNGGFETGDLLGWTAGFMCCGDFGSSPGGYAVPIGGNVKDGTYALRLGRWDQIYTGGLYGPPRPGTEPSGYDWVYQDVNVPSIGNPTLTFSYNVQTYDTAIWDWFDMDIKDPNTGAVLATVISKDGKPGSDYGTYWNGGWEDVSFDLAPWKGQTVRLWFEDRQDGYGDQNAVFIDRVSIAS